MLDTAGESTNIRIMVEPAVEAAMREWTMLLRRELAIDLEVDIDDLLELAGVAAHRVARPAAPLTTFLVGYAAAARGGGREQVRAVGEQVRALAAGDQA